MTTQPPTKRTKPTTSRLRATAGGAEPPAEASTPAVGVLPESPPAPAPLPAAPAGLHSFPEVNAMLARVLPGPTMPTLPTIEEAASQMPPPPPGDIPVPIAGTPFSQDDVVQIIDHGSRHYGMFFILGDARNGKAHGFYMVEGGKKAFITIPIEGLFFIGRAKVRAKVAVSPKWQSDNR